MRRSILLLSPVLALLPLAAYAAFSRPSELLESLRFHGKPMDVSYEAHAQMEDVYFSAWMKGAAEGEDIEDAKANLRLTIDVHSGDITERIKMEIRVRDEMFYVRMDEAGESVTRAYNLEKKHWYALSLEEFKQDIATISGVEEEKADALMRDVLDTLLVLTRTPQGAGSVYSVKFKRNAWQEVPALMQRLASEAEVPRTLSARDRQELRELFSKLNLHIKVTTGAEDDPTAVKSYVSFVDTQFRFVLFGTTAVRSGGVMVSVPADAELIDPVQDLQGIEREEKADSAASRDAWRRTHVNTILNAVYQYAIDYNGVFPAGIPTGSAKEICRTGASSCAGLVDLDSLTGSYIYSLPVDPSLMNTDGNGTGYRIWKDANGRITVEAPRAEGGKIISVTR